MPEFDDDSTACKAVKARRVLRHLANKNDGTYLHDDGYPRAVMHQDARAALDVFEQMEIALRSLLEMHEKNIAGRVCTEDLAWSRARNLFRGFGGFAENKPPSATAPPDLGAEKRTEL